MGNAIQTREIWKRRFRVLVCFCIFSITWFFLLEFYWKTNPEWRLIVEFSNSSGVRVVWTETVILCVLRVKCLSSNSSGSVWTGRFKLEDDFDNKATIVSQFTPYARRSENSHILMHQAYTLTFKPNISSIDQSWSNLISVVFHSNRLFTPNCQYVRLVQTMQYSCHNCSPTLKCFCKYISKLICSCWNKRSQWKKRGQRILDDLIKNEKSLLSKFQWTKFLFAFNLLTFVSSSHEKHGAT